MSLIESGRQTKEPKGLTCNTNFMARRDPTVTTRRKASAESMKRKVEPVTHRKTRNGTALAINTSTLRSRWRVVKIEDEMRWKITLLVAEINRIDKENQKLKSMFKRVSCTYNHLQKHIRSMLQQQKEVDGSQIFYRDHRREDTLCPWSVNVDSSSAISYQSGQQLISKKRKNGMINSSTGEMEDLPNKKFQVLTTDLSSQYTAAAPKRSVSVQTRSEAAVTSDGCQWRKYGQKMTRNNEHPRCYYRCAMAPGCPVKKQVQRCAQDPTKVITTYKGEHTHSLTSATAAMHCSSIQLNGEGMKIENFLVDNQSIPCIARISTSSTVPTITLDLTDCNRCNRPGLQLQPAHLEAGSFQHLTSSSNIMGQALDYHNQLDYYSSIMQNSVASIKEIPPATQFSHGSTQ